MPDLFVKGMFGLMMVFAASAAFMRMIGGRMVIGVAAACIPRMTAASIPWMTAAGVIIGCCRCPDSPGRPCHWRRRVSALGIEAGSADRIHGCCTRMTAICGCELVAVQAGGVVVVELLCRWLDMVLVHGRLFLRSGAGLDTRAAIEAAVIIYDGIVDHGVIDVGVVNDGCIDIHHGGIIPEVAAMPFPAYEPGSPIAVPIIDSAIKANMRTPIAAVPTIDSAGKAPVTRGPQKSGLGWS